MPGFCPAHTPVKEGLGGIFRYFERIFRYFERRFRYFERRPTKEIQGGMPTIFCFGVRASIHTLPKFRKMLVIFRAIICIFWVWIL